MTALLGPKAAPWTVESLDLAVWPMFYKMQKKGLRVDRARLASLKVDVEVRKAAVKRIADELAGYPFNPMSGDQVAEVLETLGVRGGKKTAKGLRIATDEKHLKLIKHPIIEPILEYRGLDKLSTAFIEPTLAKGARVHPRWKLTRVRSGRVACEDPNLMAFPSRDPIGLRMRECFMADTGKVMFSIDYSQIEPRLAAILSRDEKLLGVYRDHRDLYEDVKERLGLSSRMVAKTLTLGIFYGLGGKGLSERLEGDGVDLGVETCDDMIRLWFSTYSGVARYIDKVCAAARANKGNATTVLGRQRRLPGLYLSGRWWPEEALRKEAERQAFNHRIQGTAQEYMKMGMLAADEFCLFDPLLQLHDELVGQIDEELEEVVPLIAEAMVHENMLSSGIDLTTEFNTGPNWGSLKG
jgi:DNA polymerase-1